MSLNDDYRHEANRQRAAEREAAAERQREKQEEARRLAIGLVTAKRIDEEVIRPFLSAAGSPQGRAASREVTKTGYINHFLPSGYFGKDGKKRWWQRPHTPANVIAYWCPDIERANLGTVIADGAFVIIYTHGAWHYDEYKNEYDSPRAVVFSLGRRPDNPWVSEYRKVPGGLFASPMEDGERLFVNVKQAVVAYMVKQGIPPQ